MPFQTAFKYTGFESLGPEKKVN